MISPTPPVDTSSTYRQAIAERIHAGSPTLAAAARHLLAASGKGVRPMTLRLTASAFSPYGAGERAETLAEAIELVHVGSLVHDDILDGAATRRGVSAVHVAYGAKVAVLAGDYLLAQATRRVAELGDPYLNGRLAEVIGDLCEGELLQDEQARRIDVTLEAYLERIAKKTASPFELACEGGALLAGADRRQAAGARRFGFHLGRLFQLVDDMLDWLSEPEAIGKPVGQDLVAGTLTLPVLVALAHPQRGPAVAALLTPFPTALGHELRALVTHPQGLAETRELIEAEGDRARQWLLEFPDTPERAELQSIVDGLLASARHAEELA